MKKNEILTTMQNGINLEVARIQSGAPARVKISSGSNKKTGALVDSFSTAPVITCGGECAGCYAMNMVQLKPSVRVSYERNTAAMIADRARTFDLIRWHCTGRKWFRWHVSGDIMDADYFARMVAVAVAVPDCTFLAFTKRYNFVNEFLDAGGVIPSNLVVPFSMPLCMVDVELFNKTCNPHGLPVVVVYERVEDVRPEWRACGGHCSECACQGIGCWALGRGDVLAIKKH